MNAKSWLKTLAICGAILSSACQSFPKITVCVSDPESGGMQCSFDGGETTFKSYPETSNYVCRSPQDEQTVIEWLKRNCKAN